MLKTQEVVNFVNEKLNELGTEGGYSFDIHSNIGENRNNGALNGILYINQGNPVPIPNYVENDSNFVVEILVPSARANKQFDEVQNIVSQFSKNYNGTNQVFDDGKGLLNITLGKPENFNTSSNTGENVPLYFTISVLYTKGVKTSGDVHWLLENMEIPYLNDEIFVDREGNVNKQYTGSPYFAETKTLLTSQTTMFRFVFPFKNVMGWNGFFVDLLDADIDKEYELKYYDDYFYTQQNPYRTIVKVFKSAKVGGQRGKPKTFDVTFAKVDNGQTTTKYFMALIDNPFDNQTEDTRWFDAVVVDGEVTQTAQQVQQAYFESKVASGCAYQQIKAPNLNSIDITSQIYPNRNGYDLFDTVNKNYAIIKVQSGTYDASQVFTPLSTRYFYYFVTNAQIGAGDKILFDLKLDTVQTYMFDDDIKFSDCFIEKANLNRWVDNGDGTISFDGTLTSPLFEREETQNFSKRLSKRTKLKLDYTGGTEAETIENFLNNNIVCWEYCFLQSTPKDENGQAHTYKNWMNTGASTSADREMYTLKIKGIDGVVRDTRTICIAYPIMKLGTEIVYNLFVDSETPIRTIAKFYGHVDGLTAIEDFTKINNDDAFVLAKKYSVCPPKITNSGDATSSHSIFYKTPISAVVSTEAGGITRLTITMDATTDTILQTDADTNAYNKAFFVVTEQDADFKTEQYGVSAIRSYQPSAIINAVGDLGRFNPKLNSIDYKELKICNENAEGFSYDIQKLNLPQLKLSITEPLVPDITKQYIRVNYGSFIDGHSGVYSDYTAKNYTGTVSSNDTTLILMTSQYQNMLANNKNFFMQQETGRVFNVLNSMVSGAQGGAATGAIAGGVGALAGALVGGATGILKGTLASAQDKIKQNQTVDNMKNAPQDVRNAKGNVFFNLMTTDMGIYVEEYDILPTEKAIANSLMLKYGFSVNRIGNIFEYLGYDTRISTNKNRRYYFNYIKAQIDRIYGLPLSNVARADLRQRFESGLRFWYADNNAFQYEIKDNYETWIVHAGQQDDNE